MTDLLFALDSIPAIYGLTKEPYLVLTANIFALMGLRQLYFLIGDLLKRLVYLSYGLAFLLLFIGVKLVLHAMHENTLPFINGGEPISWAPGHPDLGLAAGHRRHPRVTTVLSLAADRRRAARPPEPEESGLLRGGLLGLSWPSTPSGAPLAAFLVGVRGAGRGLSRTRGGRPSPARPRGSPGRGPGRLSLEKP